MNGATGAAAAHDGSQPLHTIRKGLVAERLVSVGVVLDVPVQDGRRPLELVGGNKKRLRETLLMAGAEAVGSTEKSKKEKVCRV